jgi:hypothetical protein
MIPKLYFCFPSRLPGGMSLLFLRIAEYLAATGQAQTFLIDYADGTMAINRNESLTKLLTYSDGDKVHVPEESILVLQSMTPWSIFPGLAVHDNVKLVFWTCHPFGLVPTLPGMRSTMQANIKISSIILNSILYSFKIKMRDFSNFLISTNALIFQDMSCVKITESYLNMRVDEPVLINIPALTSPKTKINPQKRIKDEKLLKFTWVGRIVDMKYFILKYAVSKLNTIQKELGYSIEVNIIGQGENLPKFKKECLKFNNITFRFIDHLKPLELDQFLLSETDVILAMGTSALEGAKLGIPTLPMDISFKEIPDGYIFTWLHERGIYSPSEVLNFDDLEYGNCSLKTKIFEVTKNYQSISKAELDYFNKNHSINSISKSLLKFSQASKLSWKMLEENRFLRRGWLYSLFDWLRALV